MSILLSATIYSVLMTVLIPDSTFAQLRRVATHLPQKSASLTMVFQGNDLNTSFVGAHTGPYGSQPIT